MKKIIIALAAAGLIGFTSQADAQEAAPAPVATPAPAMEAAPVYPRSTRVVRRSRRSGNLLTDLIELERRKNAWLRRTFLGR